MKFLLPVIAAVALLAAGPTETIPTATAASSLAVSHVAQRSKPIVDTFKLADAPRLTVDQGTVRAANIVTVRVHHVACNCDTLIQSHNARVDAGAAYVANQIGNAGSVSTAVASYIALSSDTGAVVKTDTTCPAELTTNGMGRKVSTFAYTAAPASLGAAATYTLTNSYSATGSYTINKLCLFTAVSGGTMLFETLLGSTVSGGNGDTINVTWTVNE